MKSDPEPVKSTAAKLPETARSRSTADAFRFRWDIVLFVGFVLTTMPDGTGLALHEWVGLALIPVIVVHLVLNWNWIVSTTRCMFSRLPGETRFNHVLDALLFVGMTLTLLSGVLISERALPALGITVKPDHFWQHVHGSFANVTIGIVGVHVAMHLRWIVAKLKRRRQSESQEAPT